MLCAVAEAESANVTGRNPIARKRCTGTPSEAQVSAAETCREILAAVCNRCQPSGRVEGWLHVRKEGRPSATSNCALPKVADSVICFAVADKSFARPCELRAMRTPRTVRHIRKGESL